MNSKSNSFNWILIRYELDFQKKISLIFYINTVIIYDDLSFLIFFKINFFKNNL